MSAFCFFITDDEVSVAADSLSVRASDGTARMLADKIVPIRHMDGLIATTGFHRFFLWWYQDLMNLPGIHDFDVLHDHVPTLMRQTWSDFEEEFDPPEGYGGQIFHLGYSANEDRFVGYRYALEEEYEGTSMQRDALTYVPGEYDLDSAIDSSVSIQQQVVEVMKALKERAEEDPSKEAFGIGGSVHAWTVNRQGMGSNILHRFDDYENSVREIAEVTQ